MFDFWNLLNFAKTMHVCHVIQGVCKSSLKCDISFCIFMACKDVCHNQETNLDLYIV